MSRSKIARLKGFRFNVSSSLDTIRVSGQHFLVHELFFELFRAIFEGGAEGGVIEIVMEHDGDSARAVVTGDLPNANGVKELNSGYAALLASELGSDLEAKIDETGQGVITVTF